MWKFVQEGCVIINYFAHSRGEPPEYQLLVDHLLNTAKLAGDFANRINAKQIGYVAGLLHDIGKFNKEFQDYLKDQMAHRGPDHSSAGAIYSINFSELLVIPLAGHHGGLGDLADVQQRINNKKSDTEIASVIQIAQNTLDEIRKIHNLNEYIPECVIKRNASLEFFIRMIFSCLVDADYSDTEAFCDYSKSTIRKNISDISMSTLYKTFLSYYYKLVETAEPTELNKVRKEIFDFCLKAADFETGIYCLTVPTGGGKTLASMGFALKHAIRNNLDRVIIAIPYTSIIEQTVDVYRDIFGYDRVLEHHSAVDIESANCKSAIHLAADNWDTRIIVTTTVQLFESLFSNKPSKCRKIHNIPQSVVILDEVQTLPSHLLEPTLDVIQELVDHYHTTFVLCTATQPALEDSPYLKGLINVKDIIPESAKYFQILRRVDYQIPARIEKWSWSRVAEEMRKYERCMVVVNTKRDAVALLELIRDIKPLHLSTLMCGAHRRAVLTDVKSRLEQGLPCHLVATQVVEAGVNLDFPVVMRAVGPLDRIVQAAGRCNREGILKDEHGNPINGTVIVFDPEDGGLPLGSYRSAADQARNMLAVEEIDLHDPVLYKKYFNRLYKLVEIDTKKIQQMRKTKLNFATVAERFKMIEQDTKAVIVDYQPALEKIGKIKERIKCGYMSRELIRDMQPYLVNVYVNQINRLLNDNLISELPNGLYEWKGIYDPLCGIVEKSYDPESLVV